MSQFGHKCGVEYAQQEIRTKKGNLGRRSNMSVNGNYVYNIEINTMEDAKKLVAIATKLKGKIVLKSGSKFSVNAKSLLGVVLANNLNWSDLKIIMENDYYNEFEKFIQS